MASNGDYATKSDLKALRDELKGDISASEHRLTEAFQEAIHDSETRLLKAFYEYAESNRLRLVTVETESANLAKRLAIVEDQILAIRKKLELPNG
jgi:hypothetical protein